MLIYFLPCSVGATKNVLNVKNICVLIYFLMSPKDAENKIDIKNITKQTKKMRKNKKCGKIRKTKKVEHRYYPCFRAYPFIYTVLLFFFSLRTIYTRIHLRGKQKRWGPIYKLINIWIVFFIQDRDSNLKGTFFLRHSQFFVVFLFVLRHGLIYWSPSQKKTE